MLLLHTMNRKLYMAYQIAGMQVTLNDFQGHSSVASFFKLYFWTAV